MPSFVCTVAACQNTSQDADKSGGHLAFYRFPKDPDLKNLWIRQCRRKEKWRPDISFVCSEHFVESDFKKTSKTDQRGNILKRKLKNGAIPTVNLTSGQHKSQGHSKVDTIMILEKDRIAQEMKKKRLVKELDQIETLEKEIELLNEMVKLKDEQLQCLIDMQGYLTTS